MLCLWLCLCAAAGIMRAEDEPFNPENPPEPMYQRAVSISATPAEATANITLGGVFSIGKQLTISVTPAADYVFRHWLLNGEQYSTEQSFSYTVGDSAVAFVAVLAQKPLLSVSVSPEAAGSAYGGGRYAEGSRQRIYTYGNQGYTFLYWTLNGVQYTTNTSFYYTMGDSTAVFVAVYESNNPEPPEDDPYAPINPDDPAEPMVYYRLTTSTNIMEEGVVPEYITPDAFYAPGNYVTLRTVPPAGYTFQYWMKDGVLYSDQPTCPYVMESRDVEFVAHFSRSYDIRLYVTPQGAGTLHGEGSYMPGTKVLVSTTPSPGYTFQHWKNGEEVYATTESFYHIVGYQNAAFVAVYIPTPTEVVVPEEDEPFLPANPPEPAVDRPALMVVALVNDTAMGSVSGLPGTPLFAGDMITLTATPAHAGYYFLHWADGNTDNPRSVTLTTDVVFTAVFARQLFTVTFYDEDSVTVLDERQWGYGEMPTCITPAKADDEEWSYHFDAWVPELTPVTGDAAYYATYVAFEIEDTALPANESSTPCTKLIRNGQLLILRGKDTYSVLGVSVH